MILCHQEVDLESILVSALILPLEDIITLPAKFCVHYFQCSRGCDVNHVRVGKIRAYLRGTALKMAAHRGCLEVVKALLEAGADPNLTGMVTAHSRCLEVVKALLEAGADPNLTGMAPFSSNRTDSLSQDQNSESVTFCFAETLTISPLLIATSEGHVDIVCQLAMYNANLDLSGFLTLETGVQRISPFQVALKHSRYPPHPGDGAQ